MTACDTPATHYVRVKAPNGVKRVEVCRPHLELAHKLAEAELTKIVEYGRLDRAWAVHPGGKA